MRKIFNFLRSMRFGIILLALIAVCSLLGSVIPQGREVAWYAQNYGSFHGVILLLRLNRVFGSWYFILLLALLCLNLTLCSVLRVRAVVKGGKNAAVKASELKDTVLLTDEGLERLRLYMASVHCKEEKVGEALVFHKNSIGRYGTFITHLAILLTVIFGAAALYLPQVTDRTCLPGESVVMEDGTEIFVDSFSIENADGELDFTSKIRVRLPDGRQSGSESVRVNYPMGFGQYKIYQQTYGTAASITVTNQENGGTDDFTLTETVFLSADGLNGLWYEALYPGCIRDPSGNVTLITSTTGRYTDPVYQVMTASDGVYTPVLAFPGESIQVGELVFSFNDPVEYPGLRIKKTPAAVNALLCAAFALMIAGLFITFFMPPVLVKADKDGCAVGGTKPEGMRMELRELLKDYEREEEET